MSSHKQTEVLWVNLNITTYQKFTQKKKAEGARCSFLSSKQRTSLWSCSKQEMTHTERLYGLRQQEDIRS